MPHGITQCYLPPGSGDIPALNPAEACTRLSDPGGMQGWVDLTDSTINIVVVIIISIISRFSVSVSGIVTTLVHDFFC